MRHPWLVMFAIIAGAQLAPEVILARRLEQEALFSQRTGRTVLAVQQLEMAQRVQPLPQRDQMLNYLHSLTQKTKGEPRD